MGICVSLECGRPGLCVSSLAGGAVVIVAVKGGGRGAGEDGPFCGRRVRKARGVVKLEI